MLACVALNYGWLIDNLYVRIYNLLCQQNPYKTQILHNVCVVGTLYIYNLPFVAIDTKYLKLLSSSVVFQLKLVCVV